jgi:hypothetical protein
MSIMELQTSAMQHCNAQYMMNSSTCCLTLQGKSCCLCPAHLMFTNNVTLHMEMTWLQTVSDNALSILKMLRKTLLISPTVVPANCLHWNNLVSLLQRINGTFRNMAAETVIEHCVLQLKVQSLEYQKILCHLGSSLANTEAHISGEKEKNLTSPHNCWKALLFRTTNNLLHSIVTCDESPIMHCVTNIQGRNGSSYNRATHGPTLLVCVCRWFRRSAVNPSPIHPAVQM